MAVRRRAQKLAHITSVAAFKRGTPLAQPVRVDISRAPEVGQRKRRRRLVTVVGLLVTVGLVSVALARMEPAAPTVARGSVVLDTVKRGSLRARCADSARWCPKTRGGCRPPPTAASSASCCALVPRSQADSVILVLSNPAGRAGGAQRAAGAAVRRGRAREPARAAAERSAHAAGPGRQRSRPTTSRRSMEAEANEALAKQQLVSELVLAPVAAQAPTRCGPAWRSRRTRLDAATRVDRGADARAAGGRRSGAGDRRLCSRAAWRRCRCARASPACCSRCPSKWASGWRRDRTWRAWPIPRRLKAELKIAETQAKDIEMGQLGARSTPATASWPAASAARIRRPRTEPSRWTSRSTGALPRGAVPDLSVDGTVELERLDNVLYVGRPSLGPGAEHRRPVQARRRRRRRRARAGRSSAAARSTRSR